MPSDESRAFIDLGAIKTFAASEETARYRSLAIGWVAAATVIRFATIADLPLGNGEAYYATWSRFLAWSYYDHPPLVAWLVRLATHLGSSSAAVRLVPVLCAGAFGLLFHRLAARLFAARGAFLSLVLITAIPAFLASSIVLNPEAMLAPLWVGYLIALDRMRKENAPSLPLLAGALLGLAFLAKYTAVLLVPATFLYLILSAHGRRWLRRPSLYAGGAVALLFALPVVAWNAAHDWPTLRLHLVDRENAGLPAAGSNTMSVLVADASTPGTSLSQSILRVFVSQVFAYSPLLLPILVVALVRTVRGARRDDRDLFLASFSWPVLVVLLAAMVRIEDSEAHWAMVGFIPAAIAAGRYADEGLARTGRLSRLAIGGVVASGVVYVLAAVHTHTNAIFRLLAARHYDPHADMSNEMIGWDQVRAGVERVARATSGPVVLASNHYALCGRLAFETEDSPEVYCPTPRRSAFDFFGRRDPPVGATVIALTSDIDPALPPELQQRACSLADEVAIERAGREVARYYVYSCAPASTAPQPRSPSTSASALLR